MSFVFEGIQETEEKKPEEEFVFEGISPEIEKDRKKRAEAFKFFGFQPSTEKIEEIREPLRREVGALGTSLAAGLGGIPGDVLSLAQSLGLDFLIPGFKQQRETLGKALGLEGEAEILPTSETIRKQLEKATGIEREKLSKKSQFINRAAELGASLAPFGVKGTQLLLGSTLPVATEEIFDAFGASPTAKAVASGLTLLGTGLIGKKTPKKQIDQLFAKSRQAAKGKSIESASLLKNFEKLTENLKVGGIASSDKEALRLMDSIKGRVKNGKIDIDELMAFKTKINEARGSLFKQDLGKSGVKKARANINAVATINDQQLLNFGKQNPEFLKNFKAANELFAETKNIPKAIQFLEKKVNLQNNDPLTNALLLLKPQAFIEAFGTAKGLNFIDRLLRKPNIRKLYFQAVAQSLKENAGAVSNIASKLDKEIKKEKEQFK